MPHSLVNLNVFPESGEHSLGSLNRAQIKHWRVFPGDFLLSRFGDRFGALLSCFGNRGAPD